MKITQLYKACRQGNVDKVLSLIDEQRSILTKKSKEGMTLLHYAVEDGHFDVCKVLLDKSVQLNVIIDGDKCIDVPHADGEGALLTALKKDDVAILKLLLDYDPLMCQNDKSILQHAADQPNPKLMQTLLPYADDELLDYLWEGETALHIATWNGYAEQVSLLLKAGTDPDLFCENIDENEESTIHIASAYGLLDIAQLLFDHCADIELGNNPDGQTPLLLAAKNHHNSKVKYLISIDADCDARDNFGYRPYQMGCYVIFFELGYAIDCDFSIDPDEIGNLIELDVDVRVPMQTCLQNSDFVQQTFRLYLSSGYEMIPPQTMTQLMHRVCLQGTTDIVLGSLEAELWNPKDQQEKVAVLKEKQFEPFKMLAERMWSFVHEVIANSDIEDEDKVAIIRFLVQDMGCEVESSMDHLGRTPLLLACEKSSPLTLIKVLVELRARVDSRNSKKMNALHAYVHHTCLIGSSPSSYLPAVQFILRTLPITCLC